MTSYGCGASGFNCYYRDGNAMNFHEGILAS
jgi:hypothetical protein